MFKETKPSRAKISCIKTYIKMSTNQTLNPIKCAAQRGLGGPPITVCPPWRHMQRNGLARVLDGSQNLRLSTCTASKDSKQESSTSYPRVALPLRFSITCPGFLDQRPTLPFPGIQGSVSSHKPRPLWTCKPSDTNCPISSGCHGVGQ